MSSTPKATSQRRPTEPAVAETGCPECDGQLVDAGNETHCEDCGLLVDEPGLAYTDFRTVPYDHDGDSRARQLVSEDRHDRGLTTAIGNPGESYVVANAGPRDFGRLLWQHARTRTKGKHERNRRWAFTEIQRLVAGLELPVVVRRTACRRFRQFHDAGRLNGRAYEVYASAIVYAAGRSLRYPITMADVAAISRVEEKRIWRGLSAVKDELDWSLPTLTAAELVPRVIAGVEYELNPDQRERAVELARLVDGAAGVDKGPKGIASAAVYLGCNGRMNGELTQADVADAAGCTGVTVRNGIDAIEKVLDRLETAAGSDGVLAADGGTKGEESGKGGGSP